MVHPIPIDDSEFFGRFWSYVQPGDADVCWQWKGSTSTGRHAYGMMFYKGMRYKAHRVSLAIHLGRDITPGLVACHDCDNPICVNPNHLHEGTVRQNNLEAIERGLKVYPLRERCLRGHVFDEKNTITRRHRNGRVDRTCRICHNSSQKRRRDKRRAARAKATGNAEAYVPAMAERH